jgi:hypothetical protein
VTSRTTEPRKARTRTTERLTFEPTRMAHWDRVTLAERLLALPLILAPLAIGAVHIETQLVLALVLLVAMVLATARLHREGRRVRVGLLGLALLVSLSWSFLQWVPLPIEFVSWLSPEAAESRLIAAQIAALPAPTWVPISLEAGRSAEALIALIALTSAYLTTTSLRSDSNVHLRLTIYIEVAALLVLTAGLLHAVLDLDLIWGFYRPVTADFEAIPFGTTFVNPNHAAALMMLGALVAFGASLASDRSQRWHLGVGIALSAGVLATMSRANAALLVLGLFALTLPPLFMPRHRELRGRCIRLLVGALACFAVALILIGPERWLEEFSTLAGPDFGARGLLEHGYGVAVDLLEAHPWVGVGAGAFQAAGSLMSTDVSAGLLAFAHNAPLQVLTDLGLLIGLPVLAMVLFALALTAARALPDLPTAGALIGVFCVLAQNLVDFSLWVLGVGLPAIVTIGLAMTTTWKKDDSRRRLAWRWPLVASAPFVGAFIVIAPPALRDAPERNKAEMRRALEGTTSSQDAPVDRGGLALTHAHDFQVLLLASALADKTHMAKEARAWAERALELAPFSPHTLVTAARLRLTGQAPDDALVLLDRLDPKSEGDMRAVELALSAPASSQLRERYFGGHPKRTRAAVILLDQQGQSAAATELLLWALKTSPRARELHELVGLRRFNEAPFLGRHAAHCLSEAGLSPPASTDKAEWERLGYLFQGRVEYLENRDNQAWVLFIASADADPTKAERALLEAARAAERARRTDWLGEALDRLKVFDSKDPWIRGEYHVLRSKMYEASSDLAASVREMQEALRHLGHVVSVHDRLADLFFRMNDEEAGLRARERARALETPSPK